ncbi:RNA-binding protein Raly isoform X2 [Erpetoichthys calabaricus]|uniref:RNA-binding protein Raly isoform X2 n=1 Tax=Polypterus senegalus TaxID=55291 RepID=UPI0019648B40|nr:RNA-binding protein Raly isoform X2 [Polypterus senegalus]XP_051789052.1 RNA-binding protein Raly isoform X2 [Erpetoichthys calabaricus]
MSLKVQTSNITNKNDPKSINSRVFIGNLNTGVVKKSEVETIFSKYGRVLGCSVHKGYAFVQYANINMAGEPKPTRIKTLKRSSASIYSGYDYDYYRDDSYDRLFEYQSRASPAPRLIAVKRPRAAIPLVRRVRSLPVKLVSRSAGVANISNKQKLKSNELQAIKSELTQIKSNIDALLGRLEQITEQKPSTEAIRKSEDCRSEVSHDDSASDIEDSTEEQLNGDDGEDGMHDENEDDVENQPLPEIEELLQ